MKITVRSAPFGIVALLSPLFAYAQATTGGSRTLDDYIIAFSGFLSTYILPLLLAVAVLFFLYNMAKYFVIEGTNDGSRAKAKQNAIYAIAAFVFIFTIWAIVGVFIQAFSLGRSESICPDYFTIFGGNCVERSGGTFGGGPNFPTGGGSGNTGGATSGGGTTSGGTGSGSSSGDSGGSSAPGGTAGSTGTGAPLAELVFGTGKDAVIFSTAVPGANEATQIVNQSNSCIDGLNTLALVSRTDTVQTAYAYHNANGAYRWTDLTQSGSTNLINYFTAKLRLLSTAASAPLYIVHTHPVSRYRNLGLTMDGQGPSAADITAACRIAIERPNDTIVHLVVSGSDVWQYRVNSTTCAATPAVNAALPTIETFTYLAALEPSSRARELTDYVNSSLVSQTYRTRLGTVDTTALSSQSLTEVLALGAAERTAAGVEVTHFADGAAFCATVQ